MLENHNRDACAWNGNLQFIVGLNCLHPKLLLEVSLIGATEKRMIRSIQWFFRDQQIVSYSATVVPLEDSLFKTLCKVCVLVVLAGQGSVEFHRF